MSKGKNLRRYAPLALGGAAFSAFAVMCVMWLMDRLAEPTRSLEPKVQIVDIVRPPPPPPKVEEEPPPEIEEDEEVDIPENEPEPVPETDAQDQPPPGEQLGLDTDGVAGSDGFGLVANRGGRGLIGAGGGSAFRYYAKQVQDTLIAELSETDEIRRQRYSIDVKLWLDARGNVSDVRLAGSTGDAALDARLEQTLNAIQASAGAPPEGMPQPLRLRIVSRI